MAKVLEYPTNELLLTPTDADVADTAFSGWNDWAAFLSAYSQGDWSSVDQCPNKHDSCKSKNITFDTSRGKDGEIDDHHIYTSPGITTEVARNVRNFVQNNDYLPPPRSPHEHLRKGCILEYDIYGKAQKTNIQRAVDVIAAFFPGDVVVTFTLFDGRYQTLAAVGGSQEMLRKYGLTLDQPIPSYNSLCGHSVLSEEIMFVPDLADDWRFRSNPFISAGVQSVIGSPVSLYLDSKTIVPTDDTPDVRIGIGSIIVLFIDHQLTHMTDAQTMVVKNVTEMLETQLRSTWEGQVRTRETRTRAMISDIIEEAFVIEQKHRQEGQNSAHELNERQRRGSLHVGKDSFDELATKALERMMDLLPSLSGLAVVDIASLEADTTSAVSQPLRTIAKTSKYDWTIPTALPHSIFTDSQGTTFNKSTASSGLESFLPPSSQSHIIMPFFASEQPLMGFIGISDEAAIRPADLPVIRSVGSVLTAKRIQKRVEEADSAKMAFLSSISHELRTPMHSITTGIDLAKSAVSSRDWTDIESALADVEACGSTLQKILNDVLDYGKSASAAPVHLQIRPVTLDLVKLSRDAALSCLPQFEGYGPGFSVVLEYEERDWSVIADEAKVYRILINGLTNALKFCKDGPITVSLTAAGGQNIVISVKDSGTGFDEATLPRLLEPFTKDDWHTPGAGLGLHITQKLVQSLGGRLSLKSEIGKGTNFEVTAPYRLEDHDIGSSKPIKRETLRMITPISSPSVTIAGVTKLTSNVPTIRVLVVDDNILCRRLLVKGLKRGETPVETCEAPDGQAALDRFPAFNPDLVLTDVSMPIMDGITSAELMRKVSAERNMEQCKIYAITGLGSMDPRLKKVALNGTAALDGWLVKGKDDLKAISRIVADVYSSRVRAQ